MPVWLRKAEGNNGEVEAPSLGRGEPGAWKEGTGSPSKSEIDMQWEMEVAKTFLVPPFFFLAKDPRGSRTASLYSLLWVAYEKMLFSSLPTSFSPSYFLPPFLTLCLPNSQTSCPSNYITVQTCIWHLHYSGNEGKP